MYIVKGVSIHVKKDDTFAQVYDRYGAMLYRTAYLYTGNQYDSEDLLQEVLIKYMTKKRSFRDAEHEKAWLLRVMINQCRNFLKRSARKDVQLPDYDLPANAPDQDQHIELTEEIGRLSYEYKTPIILYYYHDYSVEEIAKLMKLSRSAVKMRLKRGREMLKVSLEGYEYE